MKKLFILIAVFTSFSLHAQFNTESVYFTGTTNLGTGLEIEENVPSFLFNAHPEVGYFIKNKLSIGGGVNIDLKMPFGENSEFNNAVYDINIAPSMRFYIPRDEDWHLYIYGNVHYGAYQKVDEGFYSLKHNYYGIQLGPGINYFFSERVAMDARATYTARHAWNAEMGGSHNIHKLFVEIGISVFFPSITFFDRS